MELPNCDVYITNRAWLRDCVGENSDLILCMTSALEYLELFNGYLGEKIIQVYAKEKGKYTNVEYLIVSSFDEIDYYNDDGVLCTTINQTINDMLSDFDNIDELAFLEALSNYYFEHNESFDNLLIKPENMTVFNQIKKVAMNYYSEV